MSEQASQPTTCGAQQIAGAQTMGLRLQQLQSAALSNSDHIKKARVRVVMGRVLRYRVAARRRQTCGALRDQPSKTLNPKP